MAEEVVKTVENVDRLFAQIVVNGEVHESQNYVPQQEEQIIAPQIVEESSTTPTAPITEPTASTGEDIYAVKLNDVTHDIVDPDEITNRQNADNALQQGINGLAGDIASINAKIPNQASAQNQLADKNFVNSSISTNTANFLGTYTSMADIEAIQNPTNNDYVFLQTTDSAGNNVFDRYKYNAEQDEWLFEYELNNSSFTAEQWATINSGLTSSSISNAINALDVPQAGGTGKYIESISQVDGKIKAVEKSFAIALLDIAHPVGSLYWTSSSENPAITFGGGTWKQIKDVFVWAKGDNDTVDATGGEKTHTLTTTEMPSHTHTFSGSASTTNSISTTNTGSESNHTHSVSASGSTSGGTYKFTGTKSEVEEKSLIGTIYKAFASSATCSGICSQQSGDEKYSMSGGVGHNGNLRINATHTHEFEPSGTISITTNPTWSFSTTSGKGSSHSHTMAHTHNVTASGTNDNTGGGQAHNNMPPYVVKYCWERTA